MPKKLKHFHFLIPNLNLVLEILQQELNQIETNTKLKKTNSNKISHGNQLVHSMIMYLLKNLNRKLNNTKLCIVE